MGEWVGPITVAPPLRWALLRQEKACLPSSASEARPPPVSGVCATAPSTDEVAQEVGTAGGRTNPLQRAPAPVEEGPAVPVPARLEAMAEGPVTVQALPQPALMAALV